MDRIIKKVSEDNLKDVDVTELSSDTKEKAYASNHSKYADVGNVDALGILQQTQKKGSFDDKYTITENLYLLTPDRAQPPCCDKSTQTVPQSTAQCTQTECGWQCVNITTHVERKTEPNKSLVNSDLDKETVFSKVFIIYHRKDKVSMTFQVGDSDVGITKLLITKFLEDCHAFEPIYLSRDIVNRLIDKNEDKHGNDNSETSIKGVTGFVPNLFYDGDNPQCSRIDQILEKVSEDNFKDVDITELDSDMKGKAYAPQHNNYAEVGNLDALGVFQQTQRMDQTLEKVSEDNLKDVDITELDSDMKGKAYASPHNSYAEVGNLDALGVLQQTQRMDQISEKVSEDNLKDVDITELDSDMKGKTYAPQHNNYAEVGNLDALGVFQQTQRMDQTCEKVSEDNLKDVDITELDSDMKGKAYASQHNNYAEVGNLEALGVLEQTQRMDQILVNVSEENFKDVDVTELNSDVKGKAYQILENVSEDNFKDVDVTELNSDVKGKAYASPNNNYAEVKHTEKIGSFDDNDTITENLYLLTPDRAPPPCCDKSTQTVPQSTAQCTQTASGWQCVNITNHMERKREPNKSLVHSDFDEKTGFSKVLRIYHKKDKVSMTFQVSDNDAGIAKTFLKGFHAFEPIYISRDIVYRLFDKNKDKNGTDNSDTSIEVLTSFVPNLSYDGNNLLCSRMDQIMEKVSEDNFKVLDVTELHSDTKGKAYASKHNKYEELDILQQTQKKGSFEDKDTITEYLYLLTPDRAQPPCCDKSTQTVPQSTAQCTQTECGWQCINITTHVERKTEPNKSLVNSDFDKETVFSKVLRIYHKKDKILMTFEVGDDDAGIVQLFPKGCHAIEAIYISRDISNTLFDKNKDKNGIDNSEPSIKVPLSFVPNLFYDGDSLVQFQLKAQRIKDFPILSNDSYPCDGYPNGGAGFWDLTTYSEITNAACRISVVVDAHGALVNRRLYLHEHNWHTLVAASGGHRCVVCRCAVRGGHVGAHARSAEHRARLAAAPPLAHYGENVIRQISETDIHCAVCNKIIIDISKHVIDDIHLLKYDMAVESAHIVIKKKIYAQRIIDGSNEISDDSESDKDSDIDTDDESGSRIEETESARAYEDRWESHENINIGKFNNSNLLTDDVFITEDHESEGDCSIDTDSTQIIDDNGNFTKIMQSEVDHVNNRESIKSKSNDSNYSYSTDIEGDYYNDTKSSTPVDDDANDTDSTQIVTDSDYENEIMMTTVEQEDAHIKYQTKKLDLTHNNSFVANEDHDTETTGSLIVISYAEMAAKKALPSVQLAASSVTAEPAVIANVADVNYAVSASNPILNVTTAKGDPNCLVITLGNRKYIVYSNNFHCLLPCQGTWYCMACKVNCSWDKMTHTVSLEHAINLMQCPLIELYGENMIRRLDVKYFHCTICNRLILTYEVDKHIQETEHVTLTRELVRRSYPEQIQLQERVDLDLLHTIQRSTPLMQPAFAPEKKPNKTHNAGTILLNVYGVELRINVHAWNAIMYSAEECYRCVLCPEVLQSAMIDSHIQKPRHVAKLQATSFSAQYGQNMLRQLEMCWVHCAVCNKVITSGAEHIGFHIRGGAHSRELSLAKGHAATGPDLGGAGDAPSERGSGKLQRAVRAEAQQTSKPHSVLADSTKIQQTSNNVQNSTVTKKKNTISDVTGNRLNNSTLVTKTKNNISELTKTQQTGNSVNNTVLVTKKKSIISNVSRKGKKRGNTLQSVPEPKEAEQPNNSETVSIAAPKAAKQKSSVNINTAKVRLSKSEEVKPAKLYLITFCGRKVLLSGNAWHGIREGGGGSRCHPCGAAVEGPVDEHTSSLGHCIALILATLLDAYPEHFIRELTRSLVNCLICNNTLPPADVERHVAGRTHRRGLLAAAWHKSRESAAAQFVDLDELARAAAAGDAYCVARGGAHAQAALVSVAAWHGLDGTRCFLCAETLAATERHAAGAAHRANLEASRLLDTYPGHFVRSLPSGQMHCLTCHGLVQAKDIGCHILKEKHQRHLQESRLNSSNLVEQLRGVKIVKFDEYTGQEEIADVKSSSNLSVVLKKSPTMEKQTSAGYNERGTDLVKPESLVMEKQTDGDNDSKGTNLVKPKPPPAMEMQSAAEDNNSRETGLVKTKPRGKNKKKQLGPKIAGPSREYIVQREILGLGKHKLLDIFKKMRCKRLLFERGETGLIRYCDRRMIVCSDDWNEMMVCYDYFYCIPCNVLDSVVYTVKHKLSQVHRRSISSTPFLFTNWAFIRQEGRLPDGPVLCSFCEIELPAEDVDLHVRHPVHLHLRLASIIMQLKFDE